ncbi:cytochrome P450 2F3 [Trichonephila clavata]|uniref:Cytochrome P450 2F3 n=1 Tax=Trichonephila clavata TaxID=2740835 RepID=A0A8X6GK45_TRICU|nr:cytochrome P450 2F3 [Trichonephila clavata]
MMEEASALVEEMQNHEGKPTDFVSTLKSSSNVNVALKYVGPSNPSSIAPGLRKFCKIFKIGGFDYASKTIKNFTSFTRNEITHHKTSPSLRDIEDFINCYLDKLSEISKGKFSKNYFSEKMLEGNLAVLFLGASDTISSSLGWLLRLMCKYKDMQDKVYAEVIEAVGKDGKVRYEDRHRIPFTFAVLMEMQRFVSIVPLSGTRKASNDIPVR